MRYYEITIETKKRDQWVDISQEVQQILTKMAIVSGIVVVSSLHTTAGVTLNENADPHVERDFFWKLNQLIPKDPAYLHSEGNSDSHLKTSLTGSSVLVPVVNGDCVLGRWQSIYFCEYDGPRIRRVSISILS